MRFDSDIERSVDPTVEQVRHLSDIIMSAAVERNKLKPSHRIDKAYGFIEELDYPQDEIEHDFSLRKRVAVRMARHLIDIPPEGAYSVGAKSWSMRMANTDYYIKDGSEWIGARTCISLEWSDADVLKAIRTCRVVPSPETEDMNSQDDIFLHDPIEYIKFQTIKHDYEQLTADDVDIITQDTREYLSCLQR